MFSAHVVHVNHVHWPKNGPWYSLGAVRPVNGYLSPGHLGSCIVGAMEEKTTPPPSFALTAALFEGSLVFVAAGLGWLVNQPPLETLHWNATGLAIGLLAALPPLVVVLVCMRWPVWPFGAIRRVVDNMLVPLFRQFSVGEMAIISLLAGLGEEMLFRGVLQAGIAHWTAGDGPSVAGRGDPAAAWFALVVVAILFGLAHGVNFAYAIMAGAISLYLGWLWMLTDSLIVPIAAHAVYDFLALLYVVKIRGSDDGAGAQSRQCRGSLINNSGLTADEDELGRASHHRRRAA